jgi:hypothetical protein
MSTVLTNGWTTTQNNASPSMTLAIVFLFYTSFYQELADVDRFSATYERAVTLTSLS